MCEDILVLTSTRNTKDFAKIVNDLSFYFEKLGTAILKEHLSVPVSITKNFHSNLPFFILILSKPNWHLTVCSLQ